jgi:hypothetical protein
LAAIGNGSGFKQGRDFGAWLGLVLARVHRELIMNLAAQNKLPAIYAFQLYATGWLNGIRPKTRLSPTNALLPTLIAS